MLRNAKGFTLIELMIVVLIIGILAAIAIPNFVSMQARAKEGSVKSNMHTLQLAVEDFAVQNDGVYPVAADAAAVTALLPGGAAPDNPFTGAATTITWGAAGAAAGDIAVNPATTTTYTISGWDANDVVLALTLSNN
jgi:type IV pilus assembly protein PilA